MGHYDDCRNEPKDNGRVKLNTNWIVGDGYVPIQVYQFDETHKHGIMARFFKKEYETRELAEEAAEDIVKAKIAESEREIEKLFKTLAVKPWKLKGGDAK